MKYLTQHWAKEHDGILFFFQRLEEMLFHYSSDIVRMPVHNSKTLMAEYIHVENEVKNKRIGEYQLEQIFHELLNSINNDKILKEHFGEEYINQILKSMKKNESLTIHYLNNQISERLYLDLAVQYLKKYTKENKKSKIEYGIRTWITMIVFLGYSPEYVYNYIKELLSKRIDKPGECMAKFIDSFVMEKRKFRVYFSFSRDMSEYKTLMKERLNLTFEDVGFIRKIGKKGDFTGFLLIESYDEYAAMKSAYKNLNIFMKFYRVISNRSKQLVRNFGVVFDVEKQIFKTLPVKPLGYKSIEIEPTINLTQTIDRIVMNCQTKDKKTYANLNRIIDLHNDAIQQLDLKNGFLNLWSILEVVGLDINSESKIENVIENLVPILQKDYLSNILENIYEDLRDNLKSQDYSNLLTSIGCSDGMESLCIAKFIFWDEFNDLREEYFVKLADFPLIRNKIYKLYENRKSKKELWEMSQNYMRRVKWHLYRLYRTRNSIVHSGKPGYGLNLLGEHLHIYVDAVIIEIITQLASIETIQTINDVLLEAKLNLMIMQDALNCEEEIQEKDLHILFKDVLYL